MEGKVEKIEHPWITEGNVNFIPTRIKWIESMSKKKGKKDDKKSKKTEAM